MVNIKSRLWVLWHRYSGWRARLAPLMPLVALAALCARAPLRSELRAELRAPPHDLAAHLADFNKLRELYPHIETWKLESQWNNYTSWRYTLSFTCGARCAGGAEVRAHDEYARAPAQSPVPAHGRAAAARGSYRLHTCSTLPLLPYWPAFCDTVEVEWSVRAGGAYGGAGAGAGAGAVYWERAEWRRALGAAALGWARGALPAVRAQHLRALRDAFPDSAAH